MTYTILIVEDEYLVRQGLSKLVNVAAYDMEIIGQAENGRQAWDLIQKQVPDIILTDINMPQLNGIQLASLVRETYPQVHLVFLTGYDDFDYALSAVKLGVDDYLLKPFRDQELTHAVARVCRRMQPVSAAPAPKEKEPEATGYVRQAMDYIAAHYADADISIAVIAEHLRVSEGHLSHVFKKQTGMTVTNYLTKTRIDAAMRMLARDHVKVYEAAAAVGYKDVTYFSATFKKLTGLSPSEVE